MAVTEPTAPTNERRAAPRLRPAVGTTCRLDPDGPAAPTQGLVWNISRSGVSMLVAAPASVGSVLAGELRREGEPTVLAVLMRVVRTSPVPTGDYMLAAQFLRDLTPVELGRFVGQDQAE
jgi:hypothetical protein